MAKRYTLFLYMVCALFIALYVMLCRHSRLATDDYSYIWQVYNYGVLKEVYNQYMQWSGRIAATFLTDVIYSYLDVDQTWYFLYPLCSGVLLIAGIYKVITSIPGHLGFNFGIPHKRLIAFLFAALLFFMSIDIGETWFWYNSISHYLGSVIAFTWGIAFLFDKRNYYFSLIASVLCFIYVGSASEVYSVVFGQLFLVLMYNGFKKYNYKLSGFLQDKQQRKLFFVAVFFLLSFIITVVAPGNYERAAFFPTPGFFSTISLSSYMFAKLFFWFLPKKILYIIAFAGPFLIIGSYCNKGDKITLNNFLKNIRAATLLLLINCLLIFGLIAFLMGISGEYRIWFILSFLLSVYFCSVFFYAGYQGLISKKSADVIKKISAATGLLLLAYTIIDQYIITKRYAEAHDQRVAFLIELNQHIQKDTLITLPLLPPSGMLYSAEITNDITDFSNKELKQGYRLKFHVVSEKKVP